MADGIDKAVDDQINRGKFEQYLEQVAGNIATYRKALLKEIDDRDLVYSLVMDYADKTWERFLGLTGK